MGIAIIPSVFAEVDYSQITLDQSSVQVIEFGNYDIVRTHLVLSNHDNEEFSGIENLEYITKDDLCERLQIV